MRSRRHRPILEGLEARDLPALIADLGSGVDPVGPLAGHVLAGSDVFDPSRPGNVDLMPHDTMVASIALAQDPTATIDPIIVVNDQMQTSFALLAAGIERAIGDRATVVNISYASGPVPGVPPSPPRPGGSTGGIPTLSQAFADAAAAGIPVVVAAGNDGNDNDRDAVYPAWYAGYDPSGVVVAAVDASGNLAGFSNYGPSSVTIAAPGVDVPATNADGNPCTVSGTSFAAPIVAGLIAAIRDARPTESAPGVVGDLRGSIGGPPLPVRLGGSILPTGTDVPTAVPPELSPPVVVTAYGHRQGAHPVGPGMHVRRRAHAHAHHHPRLSRT